MAKNWYLGTCTVACACCCTRDLLLVLVLVLVLVLNQVSIQVLSACTFRRLYQGGGTGTRYRIQGTSLRHVLLLYCIHVPLSLICPQRIRWNDPQFGIITADAVQVYIPATGS